MNCGEFIGELFRARDITHIEHLQADKMSEHVILEELYDALLDHVDSIAEMRLARGPVDIKISSIPEKINVLEYLDDVLLPLIDKAKERVDDKGFNDISAEIDMVKTTVMKKLYKLKNLVESNHAEEEEKSCKRKKHNDIINPEKSSAVGKHMKKKMRAKALKKLEDLKAGGLLYKKN
ncbi:MAG: hypothetical protein KAH32_05190 [Chlamydiia bacterium]|nr:hypothetical protein [Chlamydiia bacterium]